MKKLLSLMVAVFLLASLMVPALADFPFITDDWAEEEVLEAFSLALVPDALLEQEDLRTPISRIMFCALAINLIEVYSDMDINDFLDEYEGLSEITFTDTDDPIVLIAASLGIVNGRADGSFDPAAGITRQEAAKMLSETARVLGQDITEPAHQSFSEDGDTISAWAVTYVDYVCENGIMTGRVAGARFDPLGTYQSQQAIMTALRLYNFLDEAADSGETAEDEEAAGDEEIVEDEEIVDDEEVVDDEEIVDDEEAADDEEIADDEE